MIDTRRRVRSEGAWKLTSNCCDTSALSRRKFSYRTVSRTVAIMNALQLPSDVALLVVVEVLAPVDELGSCQPNRQARRVEQVPVDG